MLLQRPKAAFFWDSLWKAAVLVLLFLLPLATAAVRLTYHKWGCCSKE